MTGGDHIETLLILYRPETGQEIGASARAIKNTSLTGMRVVLPRDGDEKWMRIWAHASHDVLERRQEFDSMRDAAADLDLTIGVTTRKIDTNRPLIPIRRGIAQWRRAGKIGFVVARDPSLKHPEIDEAVDLYALLDISAEASGVLRPHQAALLLGYEALLLKYEDHLGALGRAAETPKYVNFNRAVRHLCQRLFPDDESAAIENALLKTFQRGGLTDTDFNIWMGVMRQIGTHLEE